MSHNFFDNEQLFDKYINMRYGKQNDTDKIERPAIFSLLPNNFNGLTILDVCCGYGQMTKFFADNGAKLVIGIDISKKMIDKAKKENNHKNIRYICNDAKNINAESKGKYDLIYSSASFHFIDDLDILFKKFNMLLKENGKLVFSMQHPIMTANNENPQWTMDEFGNPKYYNFKDYFCEGYKEGNWFSRDITAGVYHKQISTIINNLSDNNFFIEKMLEPAPRIGQFDEKIFKLLFFRPSTVIFRCSKK